MEGLGAGLSALAFWGFIAAVVVAGIWYSVRERQAQYETGSLCVSGCYVRSRRSRESRRPFPLLFALCTNSKKAR